MIRVKCFFCIRKFLLNAKLFYIRTLININQNLTLKMAKVTLYKKVNGKIKEKTVEKKNLETPFVQGLIDSGYSETKPKVEKAKK